MKSTKAIVKNLDCVFLACMNGTRKTQSKDYKMTPVADEIWEGHLSIMGTLTGIAHSTKITVEKNMK